MYRATRRLATAATATTNPSELLSDLTVHAKYARYVPELRRRETWHELVARNEALHTERFPELRDDIRRAYQHVYAKRVLPSMRSLQFAGPALETNNTRMFNCSFAPLNHVDTFGELMFLLLSGCGAGYSVQAHHIAQLPRLLRPRTDAHRTFVIPDSIEGWAEGLRTLLETYLPASGQRQPSVRLDYSQIRPKGSPLRTAGGRAPGPDVLRSAFVAIEQRLTSLSDGQPLASIDAHDIMCHAATAVASGGIRRSALISLFSPGDEAMLSAKSGSWWESNSQRAMANNSVVLERERLSHGEFADLWTQIRASGSGEPGVYFTHDRDWGTNPCCEIALEPFQFCNLTEINASIVRTQADLDELAHTAAFIGTLQASSTDFHFLRPQWRAVTEAAALVGVSMTGIASGTVLNKDLARAARTAVAANQRAAAQIGIQSAARVTTVKPAGTTSLVLGTSSGVHAWHSPYYLRRVRVNKSEAIYYYLQATNPGLLEDDQMAPETTAVIAFPQKAPSNALLRSESALDLLHRVQKLHQHWILPGHAWGANTNNVSTTVSVKPHEWEAVGNWMWENRGAYNGLCVLPFDDHTYVQAPFEECDQATFERLLPQVKSLDFSQVVEDEDDTAFHMAPACAGQQCEIAP